MHIGIRHVWEHVVNGASNITCMPTLLGYLFGGQGVVIIQLSYSFVSLFLPSFSTSPSLSLFLSFFLAFCTFFPRFGRALSSDSDQLLSSYLLTLINFSYFGN